MLGLGRVPEASGVDGSDSKDQTVRIKLNKKRKSQELERLFLQGTKSIAFASHKVSCKGLKGEVPSELFIKLC